jgi:molybdate transport system substrate-binding protein
MKILSLMVAVAGLALPLVAVPVRAAEINVLASTAVRTPLEALAPQYEKATGNKVNFTFGPATSLKEKIEQGTPFDVAILTTAMIDGLAGAGKADAARTAVAHSGIGVAIKKGAAKPEIGTTEAFKQALLHANSIGYTAGGATGIYLKTLFEKLGIADDLKSKLKLLKGGVGEAVTAGEVEMGMTQISEILPYPGAELVGPLPSDIQSYTYFSAAASAGSKDADAAKAFIKFLASSEALAMIKAKGLEPG